MLRGAACLTLVVLTVASARGDEGCEREARVVETGCDFNETMSLTSSPNGLVVAKENCSAETNKTEWTVAPTLRFPSAVKDKRYTVVMIDPDAPNHEKGEYFLHWIVSNVLGSDLSDGSDLSKADKIVDYRKPGPPEGTGIHRYIFLAYEQTKENVTAEVPEERRKFQLLPWLANQTELCGPVAGAQFGAQF